MVLASSLTRASSAFPPSRAPPCRPPPAPPAAAGSPRSGTWRRSAAAPAAAVAAGQLDREFHPRARARARGDVLLVLLGRHHLLEQRGELRLAEHAARLHVGQHPLQVADAGGERLHLAQPLVHQLEPLGDLAERLGQALLERGVQLLVHRLAHLLELGSVVLLQALQLWSSAPYAQGFESARSGRSARSRPPHLGAERLAEGRQAPRKLFARLALGAPRARQENGEQAGSRDRRDQGQHEEDLDHAVY